VAALAPGACTALIGWTRRSSTGRARRLPRRGGRSGRSGRGARPAADGGWWALALRNPRDAELIGRCPPRVPTRAPAARRAGDGRTARAAMPELTDVGHDGRRTPWRAPARARGSRRCSRPSGA
jgi:hypothetical protein